MTKAEENKKVCHIYRGKQDSTENTHERCQILDLVDKDFKAIIVNILK